MPNISRMKIKTQSFSTQNNVFHWIRIIFPFRKLFFKFETHFKLKMKKMYGTQLYFVWFLAEKIVWKKGKKSLIYFNKI